MPEPDDGRVRGHTRLREVVARLADEIDWDEFDSRRA
jgi:hypothetical protein